MNQMNSAPRGPVPLNNASPSVEIVEDLHVIFSPAKYRDVQSDLNSHACLDSMKNDTAAFAWVDDPFGKKNPVVKLMKGFVAIDKFNSKVIIKSIKKNRKVLFSIDLQTMKEVRLNQSCSLSHSCAKELPENFKENQLSLCFGQTILEVRVLHLVIFNPDVHRQWLVGAQALLSAVMSNKANMETRLMKKVFLDMKEEASEKIKLFELARALNSVIKVQKGEKELISEFLLRNALISKKTQNSFDKRDLSLDHFLSLNNILTQRYELTAIFDRLFKPSPPDQGKDKKKNKTKAISESANAYKRALVIKRHEGDFITIEQFRSFLIGEQGYRPDTDQAYVKSLISIHEPNAENVAKQILSYQGFVNYISSDECNVYNPAIREKYMDMREPLNHYFINSSHNTYLTGHQFTGMSSVEMYSQVLLAGCRCIELDTWDGEDDEPEITHGFTLTSKVKLRDVVHAINEHAFTASPYPLILSIEDHCSVAQQNKMAAMFVEVFGAALEVDIDKKNATWDHVSHNLPSPEALKGKILIKHKKRSDGENNTGSMPRTSLSAMPRTSSSAVLDGEGKLRTPSISNSVFLAPPSPTTERTPSISSAMPKTSISEEDTFTTIEEDVNPEELARYDDLLVEEQAQMAKMAKKGIISDPGAMKARATASGKNISMALSNLVVYTESVSFKSFKHAKTHYKPSQMCSFSEKKAVAIAKKHMKDFVVHNMRHFSRIYPHGLRMDSSNYSPQQFWNCGAQMVALNFQTPDEHMQLNAAMFRRNGNTGYILKPKCMRFMKDTSKIAEGGAISGSPLETFTITLITGLHLRVKGGAPVIEVSTTGLDSDTMTFQTSTRGTSKLVWEETFTFEKLRLTELAFMSFRVKNSVLPAQCIIPLAALRRGYRHISLCDENGVPHLRMKLFVYIQRNIVSS